MSNSAKYPYSEKSEINCKCGAILVVSYTKQDSHNEKEVFNCPKCRAEHSVRASISIQKQDIKVFQFKAKDRVKAKKGSFIGRFGKVDQSVIIDGVERVSVNFDHQQGELGPINGLADIDELELIERE